MSTVAQAVHDLVLGILSGVHTALPCKVISYDYTKQKASVQPLLKRKYMDGTSVSFPVITDVPVVFPASGGASLTFPVLSGDTVLVIFSERTLSKWLSTGRESESSAEIQFDLSDAIAIPGLIDFTKTSPASNNTDVELSFNDQKIVMKPNGDIELGSGAVQSLMTKTAMDVFNSHTHFVTIASFATPTPSAPPTAPMVEITHCTTKVKAI